MGTRRIKLFEITVVGDEERIRHYLYRVHRHLQNKTEINTFLYFNLKNNEKDNEQHFEFFVDISNYFDFKLDIFSKDIEDFIKEVKSSFVKVSDIKWINSVIANFD